MAQPINTTVIATYQGRNLGYYSDATRANEAIEQAKAEDARLDAGYNAWRDNGCK